MHSHSSSNHIFTATDRTCLSGLLRYPFAASSRQRSQMDDCPTWSLQLTSSARAAVQTHELCIPVVHFSRRGKLVIPEHRVEFAYILYRYQVSPTSGTVMQGSIARLCLRSLRGSQRAVGTSLLSSHPELLPPGINACYQSASAISTSTQASSSSGLGYRGLVDPNTRSRVPPINYGIRQA